MHADFQELLALRSGTPVAADVGQHVASCAQCGLELARLHRLQQELHRLPSFEPPARAWPLIRAQLERLPHRRRGIHRSLVSAAVAASLVAALTLLWLLRPDRGHGGVNETRITASWPGASGSKDPIQALVTRSQRLEAILRTLPPRPTVERAATSATIDDLQTRIQLLDRQLSSVARDDRNQTQRLWSVRVQLMNSLVYVRYAEAARNGDQSDNTTTTGAI